MAHVDGEGTPQVAEHLGRCPGCAEEVALLAAAGDDLRRRLWRFACPPSQTLGEYALGLVAATERSLLAAHLLECPRCAEELAGLRLFLPDDPADPPGALDRIRRVVAALVPPAQGLPAAALRGAADQETRTYRAEELMITLGSAGSSHPRHRSLVGLIWSEDPAAEPITAGRARLLGAGASAPTAEVGPGGQFEFEAIPPGVHDLELELPGRVVRLEGISVR